MFKKALLAGVVIIVVAGLLLGGCGKTEEETPTPPPSDDTTPPPSGPQYGGTLRIICNADVTTLGWPAEQNTPEDWYQRVPAVENLVRFNENGVPTAFLAESVVEDPEALTVTFYLRHGVKFHDGTELDADACVWNFEQLWASATLSASWIWASEIEKVDDYTVRVHFSSWDSTFLSNMCYDSAMISPTAYEENGLDWVRENAVGTGPFKQVSFQRDVQKVYERFDDYWQEGLPYLDGIEIDIIADPTVQVASFLNGDYDIITNLNPTDAKNLEDEPGVVLTQGKLMGDTWSLVGDSVHPDSPFADIRVRQAVSYAINREAIVDFVYQGYAEPTFQMNSPSCYTYNPNVVGYPYNPDKARALLAEAAADGVFTPNAQGGFDTTIWCRPDKVIRDMFTAVQGYLADVGIIADMQVVNVGKYQEIYFATGWSDGLFAADFVIGTDIGIFGNYMFSVYSPLGMAQSIAHPEEVDEAIWLTGTAPDFETKKTESWNLQYLLTDKYCLYTPIISTHYIAAKTDKIHGEQTSTLEASGFPWTFAEAWLEE
jgi:peptide/nickel transport system substrate-binding protein